MGDYSHTLGVSAVVRFKREIFQHPIGTVALVIRQASNGSNRYSVMVPGDPLPYSAAYKDLELVQGIDRQCWWKQSATTSPDSSSDSRSDG